MKIFSGVVGGHLFDVDAALAGSHHHHAAPRSVEDHAQVDLLADVRGRVDQHLLDGQALDVHAEDASGDLFRLGRRLGQLDAAGLAAAADQHLRLDDDRAADALGDCPRLGRGRCHVARGTGTAVLPEDAFCLELLQFQRETSF